MPLLSRFPAYAPKPALAGAWGVVTYGELAGMIDKVRLELAQLKLDRPTAFGLIGEHSPAATAWLLALAELVDCPILIVHVSTPEGNEAIRQARARGLKVYGETCPQYLFLTAKDIDIGLAGAAFCCSPPPRDEAAQEACWQGLKDGVLQVYSSDHAPYAMDAKGKLPKGEATTFKEMANGVPGLELRLPLLFTYGVQAGRITLEEFVQLTATRHAEIYGLAPRKGAIAVGADADLAIWDPQKKVRVTKELVHDQTGYTPYEGRELKGWPVTVINRGRVVIDDGALQVARGSGRFIARGRPGPLRHAHAPNPRAGLLRRLLDEPEAG